MPWKCEQIPDSVLRPAASRTDFELHLAALDWSLIDPIIIHNADDIKAQNWRQRELEPFTHQVQNLITFCRRLPVALIADDVGLGKTISAGLILSELLARRRINRALIICPKVLTQQWVGELDEKFGIIAKDVVGGQLDRELKSNMPVVLTTYDSARSRLDQIEPDQFDLLILDEAHKLRNLYGTPNAPQIAVKVKQTLERRPFRYVLMLTATPIQNKIWDLYSLIDLLKTAEGKPNPLGTPEQFGRRFLMTGTAGRQLEPRQAETFRRLASENLTRTRRAEVQLHFPERKVQLHPATLTEPELQLQAIVGKHISGLNPMLQVSVAQAMMSSPRALVTQARNMAEHGTLRAAVVQEIETTAARVKMPAKLEALMRLIAELRQRRPDEWRAVVFTVRRETQQLIGESLDAQGISYGFIQGGAAAANQKSIRLFRENPPGIHVIVSTDAGAEGINLQVANVIVNYDLPWNPMVVEQRIGRVQRLKSNFSHVVVLNLVGRDTVEDRVVGRLSQKLQGISQAIGDIEGILEAANLDDDASDSFETQLRKLVVKALVGMDVRKVQQQLETDIANAKDLFERQREELDRTLGGSTETATQNSDAPRISRRPPRMPARDFVLGAKAQEGYELRRIDNDNYDARSSRLVPEVISFQEKSALTQSDFLFGGNVRCFVPGRPAFERLVQHWVDHHAHLVSDLTGTRAADVEQMARAWCESVPDAQFVSADYTAEQCAFQGVVHLRAKAGNGVDSFEKILKGRVAPSKEHGEVTTESNVPLVSLEVRPSEILTSYERRVQAAVENDGDIQTFCKFYIDRLDEGLGQAGSDRVRRRKLEGDFQPVVQAEVCGIEGVRYEVGSVDVRYRIGDSEYTSRLSVLPSCGRVFFSAFDPAMFNKRQTISG